MFYGNSDMNVQYTLDRQNDLLKEAEKYRLAKQASPRQAARRPVQTLVAALLIALQR